MHRVGLVIVFGVTGCSQVFGLDSPVRSDAGDLSDSMPQIDAPAACATWDSRFFDPCALPAASGDLDFSGNAVGFMINTTTLSFGGVTLPTGVILTTYMQASGVEAALLVVNTLTIGSSVQLRAQGVRPLIIAAWSSITVQGQLDVSSLGNTNGGAGFNPAVCGSSGTGVAGADEADNGGGSGGGGGGGLRGTGGMGGPGDTGGQNAGGIGGNAVATSMSIRGGCPGGASGRAGPDPNIADPDQRSAGGYGGGAVLLAAANEITLSEGIVHAGGGGGRGTVINAGNGGGGGGSGGMVVLEAPAVSLISALLAANGGGGGGGGNGFAGTGAPGQDGQPSANAAAGGAATPCTLAGANGSAGALVNGSSAGQMAVNCGGAGGGGGAGFTYAFATSLMQASVISSPALQQNPF